MSDFTKVAVPVLNQNAQKGWNAISIAGGKNVEIILAGTLFSVSGSNTIHIVIEDSMAFDGVCWPVLITPGISADALAGTRIEFIHEELSQAIRDFKGFKK
jgi:hypothetical protein